MVFPKKLEHNDICWITVDEISQYTFCPVDEVILTKPKKVRKYNKLVRDLIPSIIEADGKTCVTEILDQETYLQMLDEKLTEELTEYQESNSMEELADLLKEDFFIKLFSEAFGAEKAGYLYP